MHQKVNVLNFFVIYAKKDNFERKKASFIIVYYIFFSFYVFSSQKSIKKYYNNIFMPWVMSFSTRVIILPFPPQNQFNIECRACVE